ITAIDDRAQPSARMSEQGIEPAENRRKPGGQCLAACPPGLTADTTVFSIHGPAQMPLGREARDCLQGGAMQASSTTLGIACLRREIRLRPARPAILQAKRTLAKSP